MKSYRLVLIERSFMFLLALGLSFVLAPGALAFVEEPTPIEASLAAPVPTAINGEWTAHLSSKDSSRIQVNFTRRSEKGGYNQTGKTMKLSDLQGLSGEISAQARTNVSFRLVREAGTISMDGFFEGGRGAGLWTFTPNASFASTMAARGFANLTEEELLRATFNGLTTRYADEIKSAGYDQLTFAQLSRASGHEISLAYIRELRSSGFENLTMDNVIRASNHDISSAYVKEVAAMGFANQPLDKVIRLKNHDVTPEFINAMKAAGFENLTLDDVVRMKNHDVTPEFVNDIKAEGYANITAATIIRLKNHDVDREFIQRAKAAGYGNTSLEELIRLKNRGALK